MYRLAELNVHEVSMNLFPSLWGLLSNDNNHSSATSRLLKIFWNQKSLFLPFFYVLLENKWRSSHRINKKLPYWWYNWNGYHDDKYIFLLVECSVSFFISIEYMYSREIWPDVLYHPVDLLNWLCICTESVFSLSLVFLWHHLCLLWLLLSWTLLLHVNRLNHI